MTKQEIIDYMYENHVQGDFKIEEMAEDLSQPQWIPCSERLPEDKQVVFVQDTNETMWIWKYFDENLEYSGPYQWEDENGDWQLIDEVVAWMPLPEPYKEEE